ncbi:hypothetical protein [Salinispira pacifica]|uniref:Uncharacterized protein n=1 Tax=Salinispira pacifica TaxID=1307761 RepID=V5WL37_9SPIO|nr:hypothetical protein [Salinispira pacifica]AHC16269.1 hypothetical protein L21SP2_2923 [Salinispira pacifica]
MFFSCTLLGMGDPTIEWYVREGGEGSDNSVFPGTRISVELNSPGARVPQLIHWSVRLPGNEDFTYLDRMNQGIGGPRNPLNLLLNGEGSYEIRAEYSFSSSDFSSPEFEGEARVNVESRYPENSDGAWPSGSAEHRHLAHFTGTYELAGEYGGGNSAEIQFRLGSLRVAEIQPMTSSAGDTNSQTDPGLIIMGEADISMNSGTEQADGVPVYAVSYVAGRYPEFSWDDLSVYIPLDSALFPSLGADQKILLVKITVGSESPGFGRSSMWTMSSGDLQADFLETADISFTPELPPLEDLYGSLWLDEFKEIHPEF